MTSLSITPSRDVPVGGDPAGATLQANMVAKAALYSIMRIASLMITTAEGIFWMSAFAFFSASLRM